MVAALHDEHGCDLPALHLRALCSQPLSCMWAGDREDAPPLQLPAINSPKRIVLVRHGQSTWNAEGRVQGSSNFSYLTKRGQAQADTTRILVRQQLFSEAHSAHLLRRYRRL